MNKYTFGMNTKESRQQKIVDIIQHQHISRQEDLLEQLINSKFSITQATLSRDLKELKVGKIPNSEYGSIYFVSSANKDTHELHGVQSIAWVRDMVIIKCLNGYANSIAASIDECQLPEIAATIAGNDTLLIILHNHISYDEFRNSVLLHFSGIEYLF